MRLAVELGLPLVTVIDTPGAALSPEAEQGGLAGEIARCLSDLATLQAPTLCLMLGEGNGGGALAFLPADRVVAAQHAWLSPLPPEGASAIVHRDTEHAPEMARAQHVRSLDLRDRGVVDRIVAEHPDAADEPEEFCLRVGEVLRYELAQLARRDPEALAPLAAGPVRGRSTPSLDTRTCFSLDDPMDLSVVLFTSDRGITPADAAKAAEDAGFHAFYVPEHSHIPTSRDSAHPGTGGELPDDRYLRILDPWVALATAAAVTSTIRLGTAVALPMEHDPITLAKTLATLDHLSGGPRHPRRRVRLERRGARGPRRPREEAPHGAARVPRADAAALEQGGRVVRRAVRLTSSRAGPGPSRCSSRASRSWSAPAAPPRTSTGSSPTPTAGSPRRSRPTSRTGSPRSTRPGSEAGREGDPRIVVLLTSRLEPGQLERWAAARRRRGDVRPSRQGAPTTSSSSSPDGRQAQRDEHDPHLRRQRVRLGHRSSHRRNGCAAMGTRSSGSTCATPR